MPSPALAPAAAIVLAVCCSLAGPVDAALEVSAGGYAGSARCADCHAREYARWRGSHHDLAMAEASPETVLGDFDDAEVTFSGVTSRFFRRGDDYMVRTDGPGGALHDYRIPYTFGWHPVQQYLVAFPGGRLQSLGIAWDSRPEAEGGQRWIHLYPEDPPSPGDPLHWTGRDQTWNYQCAECHSTNLDKHYDLATDSYRTTWSEIDVACEACHGPGAAHVAWAERKQVESETTGGNGLVVDLSESDSVAWTSDPATGKPRRSQPRENHAQVRACARCHARRGQIWSEYRHGAPLHDSHRLALLDERLYFPDGQIKDEVYVYGSFIQSRMHRAGVTCGDCHEPHALTLRAEGNALCTRCHQSTRYDTPSHHHHEARTEAAACTACHMPERIYMVVDERADHSMRVPRPDLSVGLGTPNACNGCHEDRTARWAADAVARWGAAKPGPHFGEVLHAARSGAPGAADGLLALAGDPSQPDIARASAVDALREHASREDLFTIRRLLGDQAPLVRGAALRYLELADLRTRVDLAWPLLSDPARSVRLEAVRVLAPVMRQRLPQRFRRELEAALDEYLAAQSVNAERPESHINLGLVALARGHATAAETAYRTALRLQPGFAPAYANLADLYRAQGRDDEGEAVLRRGLEAAPRDAALHHALGLLLVRTDRKPAALEPLREAARLAPEVPRYAYALALALDDQGREAEALAVLESARERHAANRDVLLALVTMHRKHGSLESARRHARDLAARYPRDGQVAALLRELEDR